MKIAVLLATYNGEKFLKPLLDSLAAQDHSEFKVYIGDDASTDATCHIIKEFCAKDDRFTISFVGDKNIGVIKVFEKLLTLVEADFYLLCDQDDIWLKSKIKDTFDLYQDSVVKTKKSVLVHTRAHLYSDNTVFGDFHSVCRLSPKPSEKLDNFVFINSVLGCTVGFDKAIRDFALPFPKGILMHDWWLALCALQVGNVNFLPKPTVLYRQHAANIVGIKSKIGFFESIRQRPDYIARCLTQLFFSCNRGIFNFFSINSRISLIFAISKYSWLFVKDGFRGFLRFILNFLTSIILTPIIIECLRNNAKNDCIRRPKISVCIAAYNGERWLRTQLDSILHQLDDADEVVIVDDASCDSTPDIVEGLRDPRIRLLRNPRNIGVNCSFEKAISEARGEIIFLSDQDDLWHEDKVAIVLGAFAEAPDVTLVLSDAEIIDEMGNNREHTYFEARGQFIPGVVSNILKSKFLGCAMAFRTNLREYFLPFPSDLPGHDMWIGLLNEWYGRTRYIEQPLIAYRRHGSNASPETRRGIAQMLCWRWQLIRGLFGRVLIGKLHSRIH